MTILLSLLLSLSFAATELTTPTTCDPALTEPKPVTRLEVTLNGYEEIERFMRSLPPESALAVGLPGFLRTIGRRVRYGLAPDITGDILENVRDLKSTFDRFPRPGAKSSGGQFQMQMSRSNSRQVSATGILRRVMFPHVRNLTADDHNLAYVQRMTLSTTSKDGETNFSLALVIALQGNLELLAPADRALVERAQTDSTALLPAGPGALLELHEAE